MPTIKSIKTHARATLELEQILQKLNFDDDVALTPTLIVIIGHSCSTER